MNENTDVKAEIFVTRAADLVEADLTTIGNIDEMMDQYGEPYRFIARSVSFVGVLKHNKTCLKLYHLLRDATPLQPGTAAGFAPFVAKQLELDDMDLKQRIGFAYLGQGFVSINIWGKGNGLFMKNFTVEDTFPELTRMPLERTGIACTWDIRLLAFEAAEWHRFLESPMLFRDKQNYLDANFEGSLERLTVIWEQRSGISTECTSSPKIGDSDG